MMTIRDFILLGDTDRVAAARKGDFMGIRKEDYHWIVLYNMDTFFVEIHYHTDTNAVEWISPFKSKKPLEPYFVDRLNLIFFLQLALDYSNEIVSWLDCMVASDAL